MSALACFGQVWDQDTLRGVSNLQRAMTMYFCAAS